MTLRRFPQDFKVEEELSGEARASVSPTPAARAVILLEKVSLTTPEAVGRLASLLGVRAGQIDPAGLKDKHAVTRQHVWAAWPTGLAHAPVGTVWEAPGLRAELVGWSDTAPGAAAIGANRFEIVVRDLSHHASDEMAQRAAALVRADGGLLMPNYFGDQRFGSARHGQGFPGAAIARGDFIEAIRLLIGTPARKDTGKRREFTRTCAPHWGDWKRLAVEAPRCPDRKAIEMLAAGHPPAAAFGSLPYTLQQLAVESFQSYLWNQTARALIERECVDAGGSGLLSADDDFGVMVFPGAAGLPRRLLDLVIPMVGDGTRLAPPWGVHAEAALRDAGLDSVGNGVVSLRVRGLRRPAFREAPRPLFVTAAGFTMSDAEADETAKNPKVRVKRTLGFRLPRGAYATVVARALGQ